MLGFEYERSLGYLLYKIEFLSGRFVWNMANARALAEIREKPVLYLK